MYRFFDKKFLLMPDDKGIIGKKVFYGDSFCDLIAAVESGDSDRTGRLDSIITDGHLPFKVNKVRWFLVYYDPNYEAKVAYSQGKQLQVRGGDTDDWVDAVVDPRWTVRARYRVKPQIYYVHEADTGCYYFDTDNTISILYEGTAEECDAWIAEHSPKNRRMTNRELAKWLSEGKGQAAYIGYEQTTYAYHDGTDNEIVPDTVKIREWDSDEWHEPLVEVTE